MYHIWDLLSSLDLYVSVFGCVGELQASLEYSFRPLAPAPFLRLRLCEQRILCCYPPRFLSLCPIFPSVFIIVVVNRLSPFCGPILSLTGTSPVISGHR